MSITAAQLDRILDQAFINQGLSIEQSKFDGFKRKRDVCSSMSPRARRRVERIKAIEALGAQGKTRREIAEITGIPKGTVIRMVAECGINVQPGNIGGGKTARERQQIVGLMRLGYGREDIAIKLSISDERVTYVWADLEAKGKLDEIYRHGFRA